MAKLEIDLVDTKTEDENHQTVDTKPGMCEFVGNFQFGQFSCGFEMLQFCTLDTKFTLLHEELHNFLIINFHDFV